MKKIKDAKGLGISVFITLLDIQTQGRILNNKGENVTGILEEKIEDEYCYNKPARINTARRNIEKILRKEGVVADYVAEDGNDDQIRISILQSTGSLIMNFRLSFDLEVVLKTLDTHKRNFIKA